MERKMFYSGHYGVDPSHPLRPSRPSITDALLDVASQIKESIDGGLEVKVTRIGQSEDGLWAEAKVSEPVQPQIPFYDGPIQTWAVDDDPETTILEV